MKKSINKEEKHDFAGAFTDAYISAGIRVPYIRMAYGKTFEIIEFKNSYLVTIRGATKRYTTLFQVGEFIYEQNFDRREIYVEPLTPKQLEKRNRKKSYSLQLISSCLKKAKINMLSKLKAA